MVNPEIVNPGLVNPELVNPEIVNPEIGNPEIVNPELVAFGFERGVAPCRATLFQFLRVILEDGRAEFKQLLNNY